MRLTLPNLVHNSNPIAHAELAHLRKVELAARKQRVITLLALLGLFAAACGTLTLRWQQRGLLSTQNMISLYPLLGFGCLTLLLHFVIVFRTLALASETVIREKRSGTWESLLLTGISARQLVIGKWWAVICVAWKWYVLLAALRTAAVLGLGLLFFGNHLTLFRTVNEPVAGYAVEIVIAALYITALTLSNLLLTAASGVVASFLGREHTHTSATGQVVRLMANVVPALLLLLPAAYIIARSAPPVTGEPLPSLVLVGMVQLSFIDNGTLLAAVLANPYDPNGGLYLGAAALTLVIYAAVIVALLRAGQYLAWRQGALS